MAPGAKEKRARVPSLARTFLCIVGRYKRKLRRRCGAGRVERALASSDERHYDGGHMVRASGLLGTSPPPIAVWETCADSCFAPSAGFRVPGAAAQFRRHICRASVSAKHRDAAVEEFGDRRDPWFVCEGIFDVRPWAV